MRNGKNARGNKTEPCEAGTDCGTVTCERGNGGERSKYAWESRCLQGSAGS